MAIAAPTTIGTNSDTAAGTTVVVTTTVAVDVGESIFLAVVCPLESASLTGVTDSTGNTYVIDAEKAMVGQARHVWLVSCSRPSALGIGGTITATFGASLTQARTVVAVKSTGFGRGATLDKTATGSGTGTAWTAGDTGTLSQNDELALIACVSGRTSTPTANWTEIADTTDADGVQYVFQYRIVNANTALNAGGTLASSGNFAAAIATYKAGAGITGFAAGGPYQMRSPYARWKPRGSR